jgi:hypothetical protein
MNHFNIIVSSALKPPLKNNKINLKTRGRDNADRVLLNKARLKMAVIWVVA